MTFAIFLKTIPQNRILKPFTDFSNPDFLLPQYGRINPIIHQIMFDFGKPVPSRWSESPTTWKDKNPNYHYMLWNEEMVLDLIKHEYPWFLETYESYPRKIQQVDAAKYIIIHAKGGIYVDMDILSTEPLDQLLQYKVVLAQSEFGLVNDFFMGEKGSDFYLYVIKSLVRSRRVTNVSPFLEVMYSTGPMFFSYAFVEGGYCCGDDSLIVSLHPAQYTSGNEYGMVKHITGMTWHDSDARLVWKIWMMRYKLPSKTKIAVFIGIFLLLILWYRRIRSRKNRDKLL